MLCLNSNINLDRISSDVSTLHYVLSRYLRITVHFARKFNPSIKSLVIEDRLVSVRHMILLVQFAYQCTNTVVRSRLLSNAIENQEKVCKAVQEN